MKKIYESQLNGWDESAERIYVYALESDEEYWEIDDMTFEEKCRYFDVFEEPSYAVMPGGLYHRYEFELTSNHVIVSERISYNV